METHDDRQQKDEVPRDGQERKRRFRIVKLEERIAPGVNNTHGAACNSHGMQCPFTYRTCGHGCYR
jgi:hypothetical protein